MDIDGDHGVQRKDPGQGCRQGRIEPARSIRAAGSGSRIPTAAGGAAMAQSGDVGVNGAIAESNHQGGARPDQAGLLPLLLRRDGSLDQAEIDILGIVLGIVEHRRSHHIGMDGELKQLQVQIKKGHVTA